MPSYGLDEADASEEMLEGQFISTRFSGRRMPCAFAR